MSLLFSQPLTTLSSSLSSSSSSASYPSSTLAAVSVCRNYAKPIDLHVKFSSTIQFRSPIIRTKIGSSVVRVSADVDGIPSGGNGETPGAGNEEKSSGVEKLPLESKLQERAEQKLKMKLAKKIRLRRKRLVRKRRLRKKGRWPPSKMKKLKNV